MGRIHLRTWEKRTDGHDCTAQHLFIYASGIADVWRMWSTTLFWKSVNEILRHRHWAQPHQGTLA